MNNSRRRFLIQSFAAAGVAVTGKLFWVSSEEFVPEIFTDDSSWLFLEPDDRLVLAMITPVLLDGVNGDVIALQQSNKLRGEHLVIYLKNFDQALTMLSTTQQKEFKELLKTLRSMLGRVVMAGIWTSWNNASAETIDKMLHNWRTSFIDLLKVAYIGLKELSYATWYGNPDSWQGIGYPGPPEIFR